jgi:hypothetical protein
LRGATGSREDGALPSIGIVGEELGWFFSVDDGRRVRPYFDRASARHLAGVLRVPEQDVCQERVHRRIRRWLLAIREHDVAVLQAAYGPRAWPPELRRELGRFTGIVVRLASAMEWPRETWEQDLLEIRVATRLEAVLAARGREGLAVFRNAAMRLLSHARATYIAARLQTPAVGGGPS